MTEDTVVTLTGYAYDIWEGNEYPFTLTFTVKAPRQETGNFITYSISAVDGDTYKTVVSKQRIRIVEESTIDDITAYVCAPNSLVYMNMAPMLIWIGDYKSGIFLIPIMIGTYI